MRKIFLLALLIVFASSAKVFAADVWIMTDNSGGFKQEWYLMTDSITEDFDNREFVAALKLVLNDERTTTYMNLFHLSGDGWYAKQTNSTADFVPVNSREIYSRAFDACRPYCRLAQKYPR